MAQKQNIYVPIKKIFLLDRSCVVTLKRFLDNPSVSQLKKRIERLKKIDKYGYIISPMLSIMEGEKQSSEYKDDKISNIYKETDVIDIFFEKARTDSDFMKMTKETVAENEF